MKLEPPVLSAVIADMVSVLTPDEMAAHRLRGHIPFEPSCETCQSCKGVHQHRRRKQDKRLVTEIHADFAFYQSGDGSRHRRTGFFPQDFGPEVDFLIKHWSCMVRAGC